jgi:adiponectin receptor
MRTKSVSRSFRSSTSSTQTPPRSSSKLRVRSSSQSKTQAVPKQRLPPTHRLATYDELNAHPDYSYLADSSYIISGYRWQGGLRAATSSLFSLHNETANVFTHLAGAVVFGVLLGALLVGGPSLVLKLEADVVSSSERLLPTWPLAVFLCGATLCLGLSAIYHLLAPTSREYARFLQRLDYSGISALIFTSNVPAIIYVFACDPMIASFYVVFAAIANGVCVVMGLTDRFASSKYRGYRAAAFSIAGISGTFPLIHALINVQRRAIIDPSESRAITSFAVGLLSMGAQYLIGAFLYAMRLPERWARGRFDYFSSHSLFHCLVVTAAATHWETIKQLYIWRAQEQQCVGGK